MIFKIATFAIAWPHIFLLVYFVLILSHHLQAFVCGSFLWITDCIWLIWSWKLGEKRNYTLSPGIALQGWLQETFNCLPMQDFISKLTTSTSSIYSFLLFNINKLIDWIHTILKTATQPRSWLQLQGMSSRNWDQRLKNCTFKCRFIHILYVSLGKHSSQQLPKC